MDAVEAAAGELYAGSRAEFVATRTRLAKAARSAGDRRAATAIGALRKPTVAAWLVNQIVREHPDDVAEAFAVGEALRAAHRDLDGTALRSLSLRRGDILTRLVALAGPLTDDGELPAATADQVRATFDAAIRDPGTAETVRAATLATAIEDTETWPLTETPPPPTAAPPAAKPPAAKPPAAKPPAAEPTTVEPTTVEPAAADSPGSRRSARLARRDPGANRPDPGVRLAARRRAAAAADAEERAHRRLARSEDAAAAADHEVRRLADRLAAAEQGAAEAREAVDQARAAVDQATEESAAAHRALTGLDGH